MGYTDKNARRYVTVYDFSNPPPELVEVFQEAVKSKAKQQLQVKGDCVWDINDPLAIYFLNCCIVDEGQEMIETLKAGFIPVESILDLLKN